MAVIDKDVLEQRILPHVTKPGRYLGNEVNVVRKSFADAELRVVLAFPDVYEMGMSYVGFDILYHLLNREPWLVAERVYAPWTDMEEALRREKMPLFSLESRHALADFDIVGFTLQYELHYTTVLSMLELGGIPIRAAERRELTPLVVAGGPCAFNPEPMADFVDAFLIGDGEEASLEIARVVLAAKREGLSREEALLRLAEVPGVYVPRFYEPTPGSVPPTRAVRPLDGRVPEKIQARVVEELKSEYYPQAPLVPLIGISHDRLTIEVMRGCTRGCRFCNAGFIYRPVRERSVQDILNQAQAGIERSGFEEVSLLSLSTSDYSQLPQLLERLSAAFKDKMVNVSFPSMRPEHFTSQLAQFAKGVRKSGLTLAPEAGTARLRAVINKTNTNEDLLRAAELAFSEGWTVIKLYFMVGQPTETAEDLDGIAELINQVARVARRHGQGNKVNVSLSPFVPKPHTPFQWEEQCDRRTMEDKIQHICRKVQAKNVHISWRDANVAWLEGVLARGDRALGAAIEQAWRAGARLEGWSELFDVRVWEEAFARMGIDPEVYLGARALDALLPWDHIDKGVSKRFLVNERLKAARATPTEDCRLDRCHACGLMEHVACQKVMGKKPTVAPIAQDAKAGLYGRGRKRAVAASQPPVPRVMRMRYRKRGLARFLSHLDVVRVFERAFARAGVELAFSQGFNPRPKIAYGPALAVGHESEAEYLDFQYLHAPQANLAALVGAELPEGLEVMEMRPLYGKGSSLNALITQAEYVVTFPNGAPADDLAKRIEALLARETIRVQRQKADGTVEVDIRPFVRRIEVRADGQELFIVLGLDNGKTARVEEVVAALLDCPEAALPPMRVLRTNLAINFGEVARTPLEV
ncbi:MAG: TIGR03960 family B12-binding radical SAM protein [candidate division KSB1 bacterium]|nr:TIGR03960 family B12-binding radical SAM protein [candidate division KSB1 bacterium]